MSEQQKQLLATPDKLITIARAAKMTPYSPEYLSLLCRKGRIAAVKLSRDWFTTKDVVLLYVNEQQKKHQILFDRFKSTAGRTR